MTTRQVAAHERPHVVSGGERGDTVRANMLLHAGAERM